MRNILVHGNKDLALCAVRVNLIVIFFFFYD